MDREQIKENLDHPRKRPRKISEWKCTKAKLARYKPKGLPKVPKCAHKKNKSLHCIKITGQDCYEFHKKYYLCDNKASQDAFILAHTKIRVPKRTDRRAGGTPKKYVTKFYIRNRKGSLIRVCLTAFKDILRVGVQRIIGICKRFFATGTIPKENRGGNRKVSLYAQKKEAVKNFIKSFYAHDVHYCRSKISARQYLPGDLSINRMWKLFNANHDNTPVKKWFFQNILRTNFNISFKTPSTDQCSQCLMYAEKIKFSQDPQDKTNLMTAKRVHTLRAKAFYTLAKEEAADMITFSFDCQKNMPLPKVPDQAAYFSRQLNLFNFTIVQGSSKSCLKKENIFMYLWTEQLRPKGCNEISSAVFNRLSNTNFSENLTTVRLICDGCGAQNKNSAMIAMSSYWLKNNAPEHIKEVQIIFPVPGHSYLPPDRVFAFLEKRTKSKNTIIAPNEYEKIYSEYGTVISMGSQDCPIFDWKSQSSSYYKTTSNWHFQFNYSKRFIMKKVKRGISVRGEAAYRSDLSKGCSVLKKGMNFPEVLPEQLSNGRDINAAKLKDIHNLLVKHFGDDWKSREELSFYKNLLDGNATISDISCDDDVCDTYLEDVDLRV